MHSNVFAEIDDRVAVRRSQAQRITTDLIGETVQPDELDALQPDLGYPCYDAGLLEALDCLAPTEQLRRGRQ